MSLPFVIEALLVARRARRDGAFERVRQSRAEVRDAETARDKIELNLKRTTTLRGDCIAKLGAMAEDGVASSLDYGRAEDHIAMLGVRADDIRIELSRAEHAVAMARTKLDHAITEFMRAQKRLDAAEEQKAQWESEVEMAELRAEENVAEDMIVNRYANRR
jgi:chromosome segregation ATPase